MWARASEQKRSEKGKSKYLSEHLRQAVLSAQEKKRKKKNK